MKMKRIIVLLVAIVLVLSMAGCKKKVTAKFAEDLKWDEAKQEYVFEKKCRIKILDG